MNIIDNYQFENFIGIFDNVIDDQDCQRIIKHFELVQSSKLSMSRQQINPQIKKSQKDTDNYFLSGTSGFANPQVEDIISSADSWIFENFKTAVMSCYNLYADKFGVFNDLGKHAISGSIKIQKSEKSQGYHMWHCENDCIKTGNRVALIILYLNDLDEGGETEFLYQSLRIAPSKGRMIICPSDWTHTHRGNPPLKDEKYIITTWIEFIE